MEINENFEKLLTVRDMATAKLIEELSEKPNCIVFCTHEVLRWTPSVGQFFDGNKVVDKLPV
jgi:hypothetical protein